MSVRKLVAAVAAVGSVSLVPVLGLGSASAAPSGGCPYPPGHKPALTLSVSPATITAGSQTSKVFGSMKQNNCGVKGAKIQLQRRALVNGKPSGSWSNIQAPTTDSNGLYSVNIGPHYSEQIRALFTAAGGFPSNSAGPSSLNVRTRVPFNTHALAGCKIQFVGGTLPVKKSRTITIQSRGPAGHFNGWTNVVKATTDSKGHFSVTKTMKCGTTYNFAAYIAKDTTNLANRSRTIFGVKPTS